MWNRKYEAWEVQEMIKLANNEKQEILKFKIEGYKQDIKKEKIKIEGFKLKMDKLRLDSRKWKSRYEIEKDKNTLCKIDNGLLERAIQELKGR